MILSTKRNPVSKIKVLYDFYTISITPSLYFSLCTSCPYFLLWLLDSTINNIVTPSSQDHFFTSVSLCNLHLAKTQLRFNPILCLHSPELRTRGKKHMTCVFTIWSCLQFRTPGHRGAIGGIQKSDSILHQQLLNCPRGLLHIFFLLKFPTPLLLPHLQQMLLIPISLKKQT